MPADNPGPTPPRPAASAAPRPEPDGTLVVALGGDWRLGAGTPEPSPVLAAIKSRPRRLILEADGLGSWDSSILSYLRQVGTACAAAEVPLDSGGLPAGIRRLLTLAAAVPERVGARSRTAQPSWLARVGLGTLDLAGAATDTMEYLGLVVISFGRLLVGRARLYWPDVWVVMQRVGVDALGVVALVNFLVGLIVAFVGAAQLEEFGASIYVANLVGVGMVRDMAAIMTAIVMAGRSGAAFAAQLGSMTATQEVDALTTLGISPVEFLVLPRVAGLVLMMPLLTVFADFISILGGSTVGWLMLGIKPARFFLQTREAVELKHLLGGLFKGTVYGGLVALAGCYRGLRSGRSSADVGNAVTSAVVTSIVLIIGAAGLFAVLFSALRL